MSNLIPYIGGVISTGGIIFHFGRLAERIDLIENKVHASESKFNNINNTVYDIHGKVCSIESEIKEIKRRLK